jgi:hypothetical protein
VAFPFSTALDRDNLAMTEDLPSIDVFADHPYQPRAACRNIGVIHTLSPETTDKFLYDLKIETPGSLLQIWMYIFPIVKQNLEIFVVTFFNTV